MLRRKCCLLALLLPLIAGAVADGAQPPRARDLGVPFDGVPGRWNAITDVPGVEVGQVTLIEGTGLLRVGSGPVRTGVTVVLPLGRSSDAPVNAGFFNLNGNGEMTAQSYLQDFGVAYGPIGISNTNAIGQVYAGIMQWTSHRFGRAIWPVVAETSDESLNDIEGFHVKPEHAVAAIEGARTGPVAEGNVGGGTGMECFGFKGGTGTSSRSIRIRGRTYVVGVLTQCNTGLREMLRIAGVPVGRELADSWLGCYESGSAPPGRQPSCRPDGTSGVHSPDHGSIIIVIGTDVPLSPLQLNRVARRGAMGLGRLGSFSGNSSGDIVLSFSTAKGANDPDNQQPLVAEQIANSDIDTVFEATVEATEEAITNALVAANTMTGTNGYTLFALPHDDLIRILRKYNRLNQ
jgi:L-aminopeptidase/D-esterase-like protein